VPNYENQSSIYRSYITNASNALVDNLQTSLTATVFPYYEMMARLLMSWHRRAPLSVDYVVDVDEWLMPPHYVVYDANSSAESFLAMVAFAFDFESSQATGNAVAILPFDEISTIAYTEGEKATGASKSRSSSDGVAPQIEIKAGKAVYNKGTHNVEFATPFPINYLASVTGSTGIAGVNVILVQDDNLGYFTIKVPVDNCTVRWVARTLNNN
jgi:hypothetical protein